MNKIFHETLFFDHLEVQSFEIQRGFHKCLQFEFDWEVRSLAMTIIMDLFLESDRSRSFMLNYHLETELMSRFPHETNRSCLEIVATKGLQIIDFCCSPIPETSQEHLDRILRFQDQLKAQSLECVLLSASPIAKFGSDLQVEWEILQHPPPRPGSRYHIDLDCF